MRFEPVEGVFYVVSLRGQKMTVLGGPYLSLELAAEAGEAMPTKGLRLVREVGRFQ